MILSNHGVIQSGKGVVISGTDPFAANVVLFLKGDGTNGSTNIVDSSPSPKTISVFGTAQISTAQSKYGGSSLFATNTTAGNFVQAATTINLSANYTFEAWIYQTVAQDCTLLAGADIGDVDFAITGSQIRIGRTNVAWDVIVNVAFTYNTFQHIAFSRSGGTQKIFLNGVEVFSGNYGMGLTATNPRVMCTRDNVANQFARQLNGYIDSVRFTDSVARYTANFNPETDTYLDIPTPTPTDPYANNVVLFLKGDGTNGSTNIVDSSPSPKTISVFGTAQISTAQSKYGGSSIYFDGTNNCFIGTPADSIYTLGTNNFTLEMWIRPFTASPNGILGWNNSATFQDMQAGNPVYSDFGGKFSFWRIFGGVNNLQQLVANVWQHHALVREGNNYRWYLNGILTVSFSDSETLTGSRICIGTQAVSPPYLGFAQFYLSHLRLTKSVRYTANFNPETDTYLNV